MFPILLLVIENQIQAKNKLKFLCLYENFYDIWETAHSSTDT